MSLRNAWRLGLLTLSVGALSCASKAPLENADLDKLAEVARQVDQTRLMSRVQALAEAHDSDKKVDCSTLNGYRVPELCQLSRDKSGAILQQWLEAAGREVKQDSWSGTGFATSNIFAELRGTTHPEEIVLVGAHFDAFYQGADDNSTGVAAVAELAQVLSQYKFDRTLRFVGFDLEELGDLGSSRYVDALAGERIHVAVVFDCLGYYDTKPGSQLSLPGLPAPSAGDFLAAIANDQSSSQASELYALSTALGVMKLVPILSIGDGVSPVGGNLMRSDHAPFWLAKRNALFITDTANFRNRNYHRSTDTPDTLDPARFAGAVQLSAAGLAYWAGGPK